MRFQRALDQAPDRRGLNLRAERGWDAVEEDSSLSCDNLALLLQNPSHDVLVPLSIVPQ